MQLDNDKLKQAIFIVALFALGGFLFWYLQGFLTAFLGALVFYIVLRGPLFYLTEKAKHKWNYALATAVLMFASFLVMVLPVLLLSLMLSSKIGHLVNHFNDITRIVHDWGTQAKDYLGFDVFGSEGTSKLTGMAASVFPKFLSATFKAVLDIFVMYFILFFMLVNARPLEIAVSEYLPFNDYNNRLLLLELKKQTIANSLGIGVLAVLQIIASLIGYTIFGIHEPLFWAVITGVASALPAVGTGIVWIPVCIISYGSGHQGEAIGLAIYSAVVLGTIENVFRFLVIKKIGDVHPLITFFGIILGVDLFGFIGIIYGPLLISYFLLLLRIYRNEYMGKSYETGN
jgi:predicted PurR-regulated permease PerM